MPYTDSTEKPAVIVLFPREKALLPLLKDGMPYTSDSLNEVLGSSIRGESYDLIELRQFVFTLMEMLMINYMKPETVKPLNSFSQEDRERLKPFAYFVASLDGNNYTDLIEQYIPTAHAILTLDGQITLDKAFENMKR